MAHCRPQVAAAGGALAQALETLGDTVSSGDLANSCARVREGAVCMRSQLASPKRRTSHFAASERRVISDLSTDDVWRILTSVIRGSLSPALIS